jgi:uncharacterized protein (TIGR00369 family)
MADNLFHFYEFGPFRLDAGEKLLYRGQNHVQLTLKALHILLILVQKSGQVIGKNELMDEVWPQIFVQESTLTQNIFILRRALGRCPDGSEYIETVPRRGYRFSSIVREGWIERPAAALAFVSQGSKTPMTSSPTPDGSTAPLVTRVESKRAPKATFPRLSGGRLTEAVNEVTIGSFAGLGVAAAAERPLAGNTRREEAPPMSLMVTELELQQLLSQVAFTRSYGFALRSIDDGICTIDVPFQEAFERPGGIVSGQVYMAAADVAMWLAIMTKLGIKDMAVTIEQKTTFLAAAKQEDFACTATILKLGRRLIYGSAECVSGTGTLLAHHTLTYIRQ